MSRIIFGAANYWGGPIVTGSQHYARCFAEAGWNVAYLSDQISPLHLFRWRSRAYTRDKFRLWLNGGTTDLEGRLFAYNHLTLLPVFNAPVLRSRLAVERAMDLSVPRLFRVLGGRGFADPDAVWIDHLVFAQLQRRFPRAFSIYRMADDPELFPDAYPPPLLEAGRRLVAEADLVIVTARALLERVARARSGPVLYVPNGVDHAHFASAAPEPEEYRTIPRPRILYAGSLEPWFDTELVAEAAARRPAWQFVIIGPPRISLGSLRRLANVHVLGKRPYAAVPAFYRHADVGIIPFRRSRQIDAVSPIKLYEYLAAGLPVVATAWHEVRQLGAPVQLVDGPDALIAAITAALDRAAVGRNDRLAFAAANAWDERFARIRAALPGADRSEVRACAGS